MKTRHLVAFAVLAVIAAVFMAGCSILGTSIEARITSFVDGLNGDRTQVYTNLDTSIPAYAANQGQTSLWDAQFPSTDGTYSDIVTSPAPLDPSGVLVDITASISTLTKSYKFVLKNNGSIFDDYAITDILVLSGGTYTSIF